MPKAKPTKRPTKSEMVHPIDAEVAEAEKAAMHELREKLGISESAGLSGLLRFLVRSARCVIGLPDNGLFYPLVRGTGSNSLMSPIKNPDMTKAIEQMLETAKQPGQLFLGSEKEYYRNRYHANKKSKK